MRTFSALSARLAALLLIAAIALSVAGCAARMPATVNTLPLGDSNLKKRAVTVKTGVIYSADTGRSITLGQLAEELAAMRYVYLGESHTSMANHQVQFEIIKAVHARNPKIKIGMEFFKRTDDETLVDWTAGLLSEEELLRRTGWYAGGGGYNFGYYRDIMNFARDKRIPVVGLNVPRTITRKIAMGGLKSLSPEEQAEVGEVDVTNDDHRQLIRFYFGGTGEGGMHFTPERFENMYAAQSTWDVVMGDSLMRAAEGFDGVVFAIAGSGHVAYNLGINRRVYDKDPQPFASVIAVADTSEKGRGTKIVRSLADYFWGIAFDLDPERYPSFGFTITEKEGKLLVGMIFPDSLGAKAGLKGGDRIISLDGDPVSDVTDLRIRLSAKQWGDTAVLLIERGGETLPVEIDIQP